jgi:hypothetical protein
MERVRRDEFKESNTLMKIQRKKKLEDSVPVPSR